MSAHPSEDEVIDAVRIIRQSTPTLGRSKVLAKLKSENGWILSEARLKKILAGVERGKPSGTGVLDSESKDLDASRGATVTDSKVPESGAVDTSPASAWEVRRARLASSENQSNLPAPVLPSDALAAQQDYRKKSSGWYRIFGRGKYDYGFFPLFDIDLLFALLLHRIIECVNKNGGKQALSEQAKRKLGSQEQVQQCFLFYEYVAKTVNIPVEDVGRQFEAEYGINPLEYRPAELAADPKLMVLWRVQMEESFEREKQKLIRLAGKEDPEIAKMVLQADGSPKRRNGKYSQFASAVKRIVKESGERDGALLEPEAFNEWV